MYGKDQSIQNFIQTKKEAMDDSLNFGCESFIKPWKTIITVRVDRGVAKFIWRWLEGGAYTGANRFWTYNWMTKLHLRPY